MITLTEPISAYLGRREGQSIVGMLEAAAGPTPSCILCPPGSFRWLHASTEETEPCDDGTQITREDLLGAHENMSRPVVADREHSTVLDPLNAKTEGWIHTSVVVEAAGELHLFVLAELEEEAARDVDSGKWPYGSVVVSGKGTDAELLSHAITRYPVQSALMPSTAVRSNRELRVRAMRTSMEEETTKTETKPDASVRSISPEDEAGIMAMLESAEITGDMPLLEKLKLLVEKSVEQALARSVAADSSLRAKVGEATALREAMRKQSALLAELEKRVGEHESERAERALLDSISIRAKARKIALSDAQREEVAALARKVSEASREEVIDVSLRALNVPSTRDPAFEKALKSVGSPESKEALIQSTMTSLRSVHAGMPDFVLRQSAINKLVQRGQLAPQDGDEQ